MHGDEAAEDRTPHGSHETWEQIVARFARFSGVVAEVDDPLTWGLDLDEETVTGADVDAHDPTDERFLRSYLSFRGEILDVETLHAPATDAEHASEIARSALSGALAAPLHADVTSEDDFLDSYQEYRVAMRSIVAEVDAATVTEGTVTIDGIAQSCLHVVVRDTAALYVPVADRALVVSGPTALLDCVDIVTRPIRNLLHGDDGPRF